MRSPRADRNQVRAIENSSSSTAGALAAATWLRMRGLTPPGGVQRWHVEIALDVIRDRAPSEYDERTATRFHIDIYAEEWGVFFCHAGRASWIRITDVPFVHGRDEYELLHTIPPLKDVGQLLRFLERQHKVKFQREHASVRTNLDGAEPAIRTWVATL